MTLDTLNDCVVFPHLCNWKDPVKLRRSWATSIASGIDGSEDRAAGRTAPTRKLAYTIWADGIQERAILTERIKAALKSGRAVCPLFGRAQGVTPGAGTLQVTWGKWPWAVGDYAFLTLPNKEQQHGINQRFRISCGTSAAGWEAESNYFAAGGDSGGEIGSTTNAIDVSFLGTVTPPPQAVLQHARFVNGEFGPSPGTRYRISVTGPQRCKVRLWFAFWSSSPSKEGIYRILAAGNPGAIEVNPWLACGSDVNRAGFVDFAITPDVNRVLDFSIYLESGVWQQVNAIEVFSTCWQMAQITAVEQTDVTELSFAAESLLFPDFTEIPQIYPVLFGKPSVGDLSAITSRLGEIELSVEEPLGEAVEGRVGVCQVEICGLPVDAPVPPEEPEGTLLGAVDTTLGALMNIGAREGGLAIYWAFNPDDPETPMDEDRLNHCLAWMEKAKQEFRIDNPLVSFGPPFWRLETGASQAWPGEVIYQGEINGQTPDEALSQHPTRLEYYFVLTCNAYLP